MYQEEFSDLITIDELCELLSIGRNYAYSLLNSGEIKAFRIGRIWKIPRGAVWEYIKRKSGLQQPYFSFAKTATPFLLPLPGTAALKSRKSLAGFAKLFFTNRNPLESTALESLEDSALPENFCRSLFAVTGITCLWSRFLCQWPQNQKSPGFE